MKKILVLMALVAVMFVSCKKEEGATPLKVENAVMGGAKKDMSGWD